MILPLLIIFLVLVCAYLEYQKKINLQNKLFVLVICVLTFTICFSYIKKYDKNYESFDNENNLNIPIPKPEEIKIMSKPYKKYSDKKEDFEDKHKYDFSLDNFTKNKLIDLVNDKNENNKKKESKEKFQLIPRLKKNIKAYDNFKYHENQLKKQNKKQNKKVNNNKKKEKFENTKGFYVKDKPECFRLQKYDNKDYGPNKSLIEEFYDKPREKGYSVIDQKHWTFPQRRPPPCIPNRVDLPRYVYPSAYGSKVLELNQNGDIADKEEDVKQTNIGSILPKFNFEEIYE